MEQHARVVDGIPMRWLERGAGVPLILLHGIPTGPALWRHVAPRVQGARCLAWEMVGYGRSIPEGRGRDISVARQAEYLVAWMREIGVERAVFAAHDLGGGVAEIAAARHPERCAGLFLTNAICYDSWPIPSVKALRAARGAVRHMPDAALRLLLANMFRRGHDSGERAQEAIEVHFTPYRESDGAAGLARQVAALDVRDTQAVVPMLPRLGVPARLVWGEADAFQKVRYGERLSRDLKAPLRRIPGGKHFTPEDHPEIVAEEINTLLAEIERDGSPQG